MMAAGEMFGECSLCKESHRRDRMSTHLRACLKRRAGADSERFCLRQKALIHIHT